MDYVTCIEREAPDFYPGSRPWSDAFGSTGSYPAADGLGASIMRLRVPPSMLAGWLDEHWPLYPTWPFVRVGPRETPGLVPWLIGRGYTVAVREALLVLDLPLPLVTPKTGSASPVRRVRTLRALAEVNALDHLCFPEDPVLLTDSLRRELLRLRGPQRRLYFIEGTADCAWAAAGLTVHDGWAYLWGGETHPEHRQQGLYRRLVTTRLRAATRHGCRFAAVHANEETSAPILLRLGFAKVEQQEVYRPPPEHLPSSLRA